MRWADQEQRTKPTDQRRAVFAAGTPQRPNDDVVIVATHDSGSGWVATPFLCDSFIHDSTPVYPGAHHGLLAEAITQLIARTAQALHRAGGGRAVDYAQIEREVGADTAAVERAAHQSVLAAFDVDEPTVVIEGRVHTRVVRSEGRYDTMAGDVTVPRS